MHVYAQSFVFSVVTYCILGFLNNLLHKHSTCQGKQRLKLKPFWFDSLSFWKDYLSRTTFSISTYSQLWYQKSKRCLFIPNPLSFLLLPAISLKCCKMSWGTPEHMTLNCSILKILHLQCQYSTSYLRSHKELNYFQASDLLLQKLIPHDSLKKNKETRKTQQMDDQLNTQIRKQTKH